VRVYQIVVDTFEAKPYPVVTHVFTGASQKEAQAYYQAHLKTDAFLRGCAGGQFANFRCENVKRCEGWVNIG